MIWEVKAVSRHAAGLRLTGQQSASGGVTTGDHGNEEKQGGPW
jgi:hypothetical protein